MRPRSSDMGRRLKTRSTIADDTHNWCIQITKAISLLVLVIASTAVVTIKYNTIAKRFRMYKVSGLVPYIPYFNSTSSRSADQNPRLALCIAGNARTFHYPRVHNNILENVVGVLRRHADVDVFFNIKIEDDPRPNYPTARTNASATKTAMDKFFPVFVHELTNKSEDNIQIDDSRYIIKDGAATRLITKPLHNCSASDSSQAYIPHALHRASQCYRIVEEYERSHGLEYTWMYRIRPDVVFLEEIPPPTEIQPGSVATNLIPSINTVAVAKWGVREYGYPDENASESGFPHTGDHFMAVTRRDAEAGLNAVRAIDDCGLFKAPILRNSESQLMYWLMKHGLRLMNIPTLWVLIREGIGPECVRVRYFDLANKTLQSDMVRRCDEYKGRFRWTRRR